MESLRNLEQFIAQVYFTSDSTTTKQDHRDIYNYIEQTVLSPQSPLVQHVPPLDVIVYSVRNIIYPTLALQRIPDLLDLLATAEFYRGRTLDQARDAIVWNSYYKKERDVAITLSAQEESFLITLESQRHAMRQMYMTILTFCCRLDLYNLWTADQSPVTDFLVRFNEYFPKLNSQLDDKSPRLFHANLSDAEISQLGGIGLACCGFPQETVEWAQKYRNDRQPIRELFQSKAFRDEFPVPCGHQDLSELIEYYLNDVTTSAKRVKEMFTDSI